MTAEFVYCLEKHGAWTGW